MNILSREKQIEVISALCDGLGIRAASRITGVNRGTVASLALRVGHGCAELHDRMMVGLRVSRLELDELWAFVGKKQKRVTRKDMTVKGDQYTFVGLAASSRAIVSYRTGKRSDATTDDFIQDLRGRVIGSPEISTDGFTPYQPAIRDAFRNSAHGVIVKTYAVTDLRRDAAHRYSPAAVVAVSRDVMHGVGNPMNELPVKNVMAFIDGQNLYQHAKEAFGHHHPNYDPVKLHHAVCAAHGWRPTLTQFYTGVPSQIESPMWAAYWSNRVLALKRAGVSVTTRAIRYRKEWLFDEDGEPIIQSDGTHKTVTTPQEKGIDVRLALDLVSLARRRQYDVALIFSQDQDLQEVVQEIADISSERPRTARLHGAR